MRLSNFSSNPHGEWKLPEHKSLFLSRVAGDYIVPYRSPKGDYRDFQDFEGSIGLGDYRVLGGVYRVENETKHS